MPRGAGMGSTIGSTVIVRDGPSSDETSRSADRAEDSNRRRGFIAVPRFIVALRLGRPDACGRTQTPAEVTVAIAFALVADR